MIPSKHLKNWPKITKSGITRLKFGGKKSTQNAIFNLSNRAARGKTLKGNFLLREKNLGTPIIFTHEDRFIEMCYLVNNEFGLSMGPVASPQEKSKISFRDKFCLKNIFWGPPKNGYENDKTGRDIDFGRPIFVY